MKKLVLYGAGSGSREILQSVRDINQSTPTWQVLGFVDDSPERANTRVDDLPVLGSLDEVASLETVDDPHQIEVACGIMNPAVRRRIFDERVAAAGMQLATIIHPSVFRSPDLRHGPGCVLMPGVKVGFDVALGRGVFVLWNVVLGHDLRAGDFVSVLSGAVVAGGCTLHDEVTIGAGATLNVGTTVGRNSIVGVGTTAMRNVPPDTTLVSMPRQTKLPR